MPILGLLLRVFQALFSFTLPIRVLSLTGMRFFGSAIVWTFSMTGTLISSIPRRIWDAIAGAEIFSNIRRSTASKLRKAKHIDTKEVYSLSDEVHQMFLKLHLHKRKKELAKASIHDDDNVPSSPEALWKALRDQCPSLNSLTEESVHYVHAAILDFEADTQHIDFLLGIGGDHPNTILANNEELQQLDHTIADIAQVLIDSIFTLEKALLKLLVETVTTQEKEQVKPLQRSEKLKFCTEHLFTRCDLENIPEGPAKSILVVGINMASHAWVQQVTEPHDKQ